MAVLIILLIIAGCAVYLYLKGTLVNSFVLIIAAVFAGAVAFGYFELLANVFVSRSTNGSFSGIVPWAQPLSFVLLFVMVFAVLQTIVPQLMLRQKIDFGIMPERIGRIVCGIILGFISAGLLLTVLAMAPLQNKYPYQRFDSQNPEPQKPNKVYADGFTAGWFSLLSNGCFSDKTSFAALHPGFIDQLFLNRHGISDDVLITDSTKVIEVQNKNAVWLAPENLTDTQSNSIEPKAGHNLTIVRIGFKSGSMSNLKFTLSQLRLICKQKNDSLDIFAGKGQNVYPLGYFQSGNQVELKNLGEKILLTSSDYTDSGIKWIDFAFYVPSDSIPVLVEFRQNEIARLPSLTPADQSPRIIPFLTLPVIPTPEQKPDNITSDLNKPADTGAN
jgi:hypothetical protein